MLYTSLRSVAINVEKRISNYPDTIFALEINEHNGE